MMAVAALVLYLIWAALAFGWRTIAQYRRTGDTGLRLHASPYSPQWWAKIGFAIAIGSGFAAPIAAVAGLDNVAVLDVGWLQASGIVVTVIGIVLTIVAQLAMGASWRIGVDQAERTELVTHSMFGLVRNPIFTAMLITSMGVTAMIPHVLSLAGLLALVVALEVQVRLVEEPYLVDAQGETYRTYARRVGRFVPGVGRIG
jgi:protein-S-isoprenylcysteine O-methyltransferase Ste14